MRLKYLALFCLGVSCSSSSDIAAPLSNRVVTNGNFTITLTDKPAIPGVFYALPAVTAKPGALSITGTQYGSVCATSVAGTDSVSGSHVTLQMVFGLNTGVACPADIRAVTYTGDITGIAPGTYDVDVVFASADVPQPTVVRTLRVTVP